MGQVLESSRKPPETVMEPPVWDSRLGMELPPPVWDSGLGMELPPFVCSQIYDMMSKEREQLREKICLKLPAIRELLIMLELKSREQQRAPEVLTVLEGLNKPLCVQTLQKLLAQEELLKQHLGLQSLELQLTELKILEQRLLTALEQRRRLLIVLEGLKPREQRRLHIVLEGLKPGEQQQRLLSVMEELKPVQQQYRLLEEPKLRKVQELLTVLEQLKLLDQRKLLTLLEGLKTREQWKLLALMKDLGKLKRKKLLRLLEEMEPVKLLKLLERVGPVERQNFYQLLVLLELLLQLLVVWLIVYLSEDGDCWGGLRNLLLGDWWLEFWEIILLAAGDVERNPGPRRITDEQLKNINATVLGIGDIPEVFDAVHNCRAKWRNLCLILGISDDDLSAIKREQSDDPDNCLREGLTRWLKGDYDTEKHDPPTWRGLVKAVDNSAGGNDYALALDIAEEHRAEVQSVLKNTEDFHHQEKAYSRRGFQQSSEFSKMFGSMIRSIGRSLKVDDLRRFLRYFSNPYSPHQRYIKPSIYEGAEETGDILDRLYPEYINPENTYLLEEIVRESCSRQCKRLLEQYTKKYE